MDISENVTIPDPSGHSLFLEVSWGAYARLFELGQKEDRAVVVGSLAGAEVRVDGPDIAPVLFHFEREGHQVCLIPAYRAELRVNAARVTGPVVFEERAAIEFSGMRVDAMVHHRRPAVSESLPPPPSNGAAPEGLAYLAALPDENMSTTMVRTPAAAPSHRVGFDLETAKVPLSAFDQGFRPIQTTEKIPKPNLVPPAPSWEKTDPIPPLQGKAQPLGPNGTEMMRAVRFEQTESRGAAGIQAQTLPAPKPPVRKPLDPRQTITWDMKVRSPVNSLAESRAQSTLPNHACSDDPTEFDLPAFTNPEPAPNPIERVKPKSSSARATAAPARPLLGRAARHARAATTKGMAWITRLGTVAKKRPVPVATGALTSALVLALALVGLTTIMPASAPPVARPVASAKASARLVPSATAPAESRSEKSSTSVFPVLSPPVAVLEATPSPVPSARPSKKSAEPADPEVVQAVGHLAAGRHSEAQRAYARLALRTPEGPAFGALTALLKKRSDPACARGTASPKKCPEMKP